MSQAITVGILVWPKGEYIVLLTEMSNTYYSDKATAHHTLNRTDISVEEYEPFSCSHPP
jgi:hypothetical protein